MVFFPKVTQGKHFKALRAHQSEMPVVSSPDETPSGVIQGACCQLCPILHHSCDPGAQGHPQRPKDVAPPSICTVILKMPPVHVLGTLSPCRSVILKTHGLGPENLFATTMQMANTNTQNEHFTKAGLCLKSYRPFPTIS